ncbi:MAG: hypothetical protein HUN04_14905 [Desulfobacter sp.]|nr:MAG: hypothetical protein HUN04_14905 [Desulfobacter sp.]
MNRKLLVTTIAAAVLGGSAFIIFKIPPKPMPSSIALQAAAQPVPDQPDNREAAGPLLKAEILPPPPPQKQRDSKRIIVLEQATGTSGKAPAREAPDESLEIEWQLNQIFEAEAMETFPIYTVQTHNPFKAMENPEFFGPPENEIWIRIKPESAGEMKEVMAQVADLYRVNAAQPEDEITVLQWVGGRPWAKETYRPENFNN